MSKTAYGVSEDLLNLAAGRLSGCTNEAAGILLQRVVDAYRQ